MCGQPFTLLMILATTLAGCQSPTFPDAPATSFGANASHTTQVLAYVAGREISLQAMLPPLLEAAGGEVLGDVVVDQLVARRLAAEGITLSPDAIAAERELVLRTLSPDADDAVRLLNQLRQQRNLGEQRFASLLERNAGLRALVADRVKVTDAAVAQAYRQTYGPARRVRLLMTRNLAEAQRLREALARPGTSFGELAALHSTDASAAQGGLLSPIRGEDTSYPAALRQAIAALEPGQISDPVALDNEFALLKLEQIMPGSGVAPEAVDAALRDQVRRRAERVLMQQLVRELVSQAQVVILDSTLARQWETRRAELLRDQADPDR